jgi:hypothetical protein
MAIHSKYLEALEAVIATALNIVKNRPLADLYVRKDHTGHFRIRVQRSSCLSSATGWDARSAKCARTPSQAKT